MVCMWRFRCSQVLWKILSHENCIVKCIQVDDKVCIIWVINHLNGLICHLVLLQLRLKCWGLALAKTAVMLDGKLEKYILKQSQKFCTSKHMHCIGHTLELMVSFSLKWAFQSQDEGYPQLKRLWQWLHHCWTMQHLEPPYLIYGQQQCHPVNYALLINKEAPMNQDNTHCLIWQQHKHQIAN